VGNRRAGPGQKLEDYAVYNPSDTFTTKPKSVTGGSLLRVQRKKTAVKFSSENTDLEGSERALIKGPCRDKRYTTVTWSATVGEKGGTFSNLERKRKRSEVDTRQRVKEATPRPQVGKKKKYSGKC